MTALAVNAIAAVDDAVCDLQDGYVAVLVHSKTHYVVYVMPDVALTDADIWKRYGSKAATALKLAAE